MTDDNNSEFFDENMLALFRAHNGAYSRVTEQEAQKSQITITGPEAEIVVGHFSKEDIHHGPKNKDPAKATKEFKLFNSDGITKVAELTVNYPKPPKGELQVYCNKNQGFKPRGGDIWFTYIESETDKIVIGSMAEEEWHSFVASSDLAIMQEDGNGLLQTETEDLVFQEIINQPVTAKTTALIQRMQFPRSRSIALQALEASEYKCEINPDHLTFINKTTDKPYIEAHHLVPLNYQADFENSLDVQSNIVAVCPLCHRKMHHGTTDEYSIILEKLYNDRTKSLNGSGIPVTLEKLKEYYN